MLVSLRFESIGPLCANMTETSCVTAISEQGGKEKTQHDDIEWLCSSRGSGDGGSGRPASWKG